VLGALGPHLDEEALRARAFLSRVAEVVRRAVPVAVVVAFVRPCGLVGDELHRRASWGGCERGLTISPSPETSRNADDRVDILGRCCSARPTSRCSGTS